MGRYFNDDMTEDQNEDYDAYLEHFGIPKEKWDATVRAKYDQLHHKTEDSLRKAKLHANSIGKQAKRSLSDTKNYFTKKKYHTLYSYKDPVTGATGKLRRKSTDFHEDQAKTQAKVGNSIANATERSPLSRKAKNNIHKANSYFNEEKIRSAKIKVSTKGHGSVTEDVTTNTDFDRDLKRGVRKIKKAGKAVKNQFSPVKKGSVDLGGGMTADYSTPKTDNSKKKKKSGKKTIRLSRRMTATFD